METSSPSGITRGIFENHLFEANFFSDALVRECQKFSQSLTADIEALRLELKGLFATIANWGDIEANIEGRIVTRLLNFLGWPFLQQETYVIQGRQLRPDFSLFADEESRDNCSQQDAEQSHAPRNVKAFVEVKAANVKLDTGKIKREANPYIQLMEYLSYTRLEKGFLCNGKELWLVDNSQVSTAKRYVKVDLVALAEHGTTLDWQLFYLLFSKKAHLGQIETADQEAGTTAFENLVTLDSRQKNLSECELRDFIYGFGGKTSMIELVGKALYRAAQARKESVSLEDIFLNAQFFAFRLLFLAFFESKYFDLLNNYERCQYQEISLQEIHKKFADFDERKASCYDGWNTIQTLFATIDKGNENLFIPLFNGGLFSPEHAPMLAWPRVLDNRELREVLDMLYLYDGKYRDFSVLSVTQLGTIYEGLLGFEFRITQDTIYYVEYQSKKGKDITEGYFDIYDYNTIKKDNRYEILNETKYEKGNLYFVSNSNSRKTTATYYTPSSLTFPLVKRAIDHLLDHLGNASGGSASGNASILDVRILDSACGSGHLLVEALNYLTHQALLRVESDTRLHQALTEEKQRIAEELVRQCLIAKAEDADIDELSVLKRILLKKNIYGVDIQQFSIELTHLSLWIETFIFGTPLSFLEHHIKQGNSLIGCSRKKLDNALAEVESTFALLGDKFRENRTTLFNLYQKLSSLRDTTAEDIRQSKKIYNNEIQPIINEMNIFFDCITMKEIKQIQGKKTYSCTNMFEFIDKGLHSADNADGKKFIEEIMSYRKEFSFFNWQLEFPEAFANGNTSGFHVIIGNPPWEKTKFTDLDFFSQYRSNYRSLSNSKKKAVQDNLLTTTAIKKKYSREKEYTQAVNEYYKLSYPRNSGAGDGNLFRFFVERSLALLRPAGTLNYILPTGFMTEEGSDTLRRYALEEHHILAFDGFENRKKLFPDIDSRYKFGLLQIEKSARTAVQDANARLAPDQAIGIAPERKITRCRFMLTDPAELADEGTAFDYSLQDVQQLSSDHWAFMEVRHGRTDMDILTKLYGKFEPLSPSWLDFRSELHATNDKAIFREDKDEGDLPLYKGANIWQYDSCYWERTGKEENAPQYWLNPTEFDSYLKKTEISRLIADVYAQLEAPAPRMTRESNVLEALGLKKREELGEFVQPDRQYYRLGFRDIARDTDERTLIAAVVPPNIGAQNTMPLSIPKKYILSDKQIVIEQFSYKKLFFTQAIFNSLLLDWVLRFSVAIHVNKTYLMRLPVPQPTDQELTDNPVYAELVGNSLLLSCHNNRDAFSALLPQYNLTADDIPGNQKQYTLMRATTDKLVADLYGVTKQEMEQILKGFPLFAEKNAAYTEILLDSF